MTWLLARIMLAIFMLPLAAMVYLIVLVWAFHQDLERSLRLIDRWEWLSAGTVAATFVAAYWTMLWRRAVRWNGWRVQMTFAAGAAACVVAVVIGAMCTAMGEEFGIFVGTALAPMLWLVATAFIWRETPQERAQRLAGSRADAVVCPACGYNLTGLAGTRCPECGKQYTLDELLASQPGREGAEVEQV